MADGNDADSVRFTLRPRPSQVSLAANLGVSTRLPRPIHTGFRMWSHLLQDAGQRYRIKLGTARVGLSPAEHMVVLHLWVTTLHSPHPCRIMTW